MCTSRSDRQTDTDRVRDKAGQRVVHRIIAPDKKLVFSGGGFVESRSIRLENYGQLPMTGGQTSRHTSFR